MAGGATLPDLYEELQASNIGHHNIRWLVIGVLSWTLWTIRNRLVIQRTPLRRPTDAILQTLWLSAAVEAA